MPVYQPGRPIEEVARELHLDGDRISKLASNENPLGPSPKALEAMRRILPQLHLYPDGNAFYLKRKLAEKLELKPENFILGNGSNEIIEFVGHALMAPGSEVVVSQYCFAVYPIVAHLFGAKLVSVTAKSFAHDLSAMLNAVTSKTRVIFVANPNNPTGTIVQPEALLQFAADLPSHVLLVMDEAYIEFLDDAPDFLPTIRSGKRQNIVLMRTFSKIYGLAGLRLGYGIAHPDLISAFEKVRQPFNVNALVQAAAMGAVDDTQHISNTLRLNQAGLGYFEAEFKKLGLEYVPSKGNFLLVKVGDGQSVFNRMQSLGVIVRPMGGYQLPNWIRVTVGTAGQNEECVSALKSALGPIG